MRTIIATTDFSDAANHAVSYAASLTRESGATLYLLYVFHVPVSVSEAPMIFDVTLLEKAEKEKIEALAQTITRDYGITCRGIVQMGFTVDEINEQVQFYNADLVVMGMHGRGKIAEILIGSTTINYIRQAEVPVLIVPEKAEYHSPKSLALATDLKATNLRSLEPLKEAATLFKARLFVVNVTRDGGNVPPYDKSVAGIEMGHYLQEVEHYFFYPENADIVEGLDHFIAENPIHWLAMIPRKHTLFERLFNTSITKKMAYHTRIPLLILPEKEVEKEEAEKES